MARLHLRRGKGRAHDAERGAVLVEAALITPLFVLLIIGIIEFGLLFLDYLTASHATGSAARTATAQADNRLADFEILETMRDEADELHRANIERIVVFNAGSVDGSIDDAALAGCKTAAVSGKCNVYTSTDLDRPSAQFGCNGTSPDRFWCPSTRKAALTVASGGPPDYIGVWVQYRHDQVTGMFGSVRTITDEAVMRIEPSRE